MAEKIVSDVVLGLSNKEVNALTDLFDAQEDLDPRLADLNNTIQTL